MGQIQGGKLHGMGGLHVFEDSQAEERASRVALAAKDPPAGAGDLRHWLNPGSGRSPARGNGNPLQYSCLGNPMDRGAWWPTVQGITKSQT